MNVVKFAEALHGKPLSEYQKKLLEFMITLPKNSKVVYGRNGKYILLLIKEKKYDYFKRC